MTCEECREIALTCTNRTNAELGAALEHTIHCQECMQWTEEMAKEAERLLSLTAEEDALLEKVSKDMIRRIISDPEAR